MAQQLLGKRRCYRFKEILRSHPVASAEASPRSVIFSLIDSARFAASVAALEKMLEILAQKSTMPWQIAGDELTVAAPVVDGPAGNRKEGRSSWYRVDRFQPETP